MIRFIKLFQPEKSLYVLLVALLLGSISSGRLLASSDKPQYAALLVEKLRNGAPAVVRDDIEVFEVIDAGKALKKVRYAVTIYGADALKYSEHRIPYDKLHTLLQYSAAVYDRNGKLVARMKKSDVNDVAPYDDVTFVSDIRLKHIAMGHKEYPYTFEVEYEIESRNLLFYTTWYPQPNPAMPVEKSTLEVILPISFPALRYEAFNSSVEPKITKTDKVQTYRWQWLQRKAIPKEERKRYESPEAIERIYTAPGTFEVEGYKGSLESWESFGFWQLQLLEGRSQLPEATMQKVQELIANIPERREQVKKLYEFMQSRTRYVGVQLGLGGWQPFPAVEVDKKGYGDCKALTNYTKALLEVAGIPSYYALVRAGDDAPPLRTNFPSSQFNHVILCVPFPSDTLWLECTSQTQAAGYMGRFTDNRYALLITPEGGKLVKTPAYKLEHNFINRRADIRIEQNGDAEVKYNATYSGYMQDEEHRGQVALASKELQKKWLNQRVPLADFQLNDFQLERIREEIPLVEESLNISARQVASVSGKRLFLRPDIFGAGEARLKVTFDKDSLCSVSPYSYSVSDTLVFILPEGYYPEGTLRQVEQSCSFGRLNIQMQMEEGNRLRYIRSLELNNSKGTVVAAAEWEMFRQEIQKALKANIVFVNKT